jgi:Xaa-Pro aminopeptidase
MDEFAKRHGVTHAFTPIVAVDANSAVPHYDTSRGAGTVKSGSAVLIDCGLRYHEYVSDITRMFFVGTVSDEMRIDYEALQRAQKKTVEFLKRERNGTKIDTFCRSEIGTTIPTYPHSTGHGIGLAIHESPRISKNVSTPLEEGMVFTIEPGIYREGKWGMRVEDTVAIVNGEIEVLTHFPTSALLP